MNAKGAGSMAKENCWEFHKCGREPGGAKVKELGVCPASVEVRLDGVNCGKNGGRACWVISGTYCKGKVCGTFAQKLQDCIKCEFYKKVVLEERQSFWKSEKIMEKLK
jgi:hypothetical protein